LFRERRALSKELGVSGDKIPVDLYQKRINGLKNEKKKRMKMEEIVNNVNSNGSKGRTQKIRLFLCCFFFVFRRR
jgi:hypothetical protein